MTVVIDERDQLELADRDAAGEVLEEEEPAVQRIQVSQRVNVRFLRM